MTTLSLSSLCKPFEQALTVFIDKISQEQTRLKKSDLIQLWNTGMLHDSSRIIIKEKPESKTHSAAPSPMIKSKSVEVSPLLQHLTPSSSIAVLPPPISLPKSVLEEKKSEPKIQTSITDGKSQCIFRITRGEKTGEQCPARAKQDMYCVKHYKEPKDRKSDAISTVSDSNQDMSITPVVQDSGSEVKLKKKIVKPVQWNQVGAYRVIANTSVVLNETNTIIGYMENGTVVYAMNKEIEQVKKEYQLSFVSEEVDE